MSTVYYKDIDLSFEKTSTGDFSALTNLNAIKQDIYNTLFIAESENFFEQEFGEGIQDYLFDFNDAISLSSIYDLVKRTIDNDTRVTALEDLYLDPQGSELIINIKMKMVNVIETQEVSLIFKKLR